jgi:hypothetical protein
LEIDSWINQIGQPQATRPNMITTAFAGASRRPLHPLRNKQGLRAARDKSSIVVGICRNLGVISNYRRSQKSIRVVDHISHHCLSIRLRNSFAPFEDHAHLNRRRREVDFHF